MAKATERTSNEAIWSWSFGGKKDDEVLRLTLRLIDSSSFFRHLTIISQWLLLVLLQLSSPTQFTAERWDEK